MPEETKQREFLGMRIEGEIYATEKRKNQRSQEELGEILQKALSHKEIAGIAWRQYTPYFNDGEPCVFSAQEPSVLFADHLKFNEDEDPDEDAYGLDDEVPWQSQWSDEFKKRLGSTKYDYMTRSYSLDTPGEYPEDIRNDYFDAASAISGGEFDDALMGLFGDHAVVEIRDGKITVEEYQHD